MPFAREPEPSCRPPLEGDPAEILEFAAAVGAGTGVDRPGDPGGEWWLDWTDDGITIPLASWIPGSGFRLGGAGVPTSPVLCPREAAGLAAVAIRQSGLGTLGARGPGRP